MTDNPERVTVPSIDSIDELWRCVADCATQYHRVHKDKQLGVFLTNFVEETFLSVKENVGTQDGDKWERRGRSLRHVHYLTPHVLDVFNNDIRQCHTAYADNTERGGDGVTQLQRTLDECTKVLELLTTLKEKITAVQKKISRVDGENVTDLRQQLDKLNNAISSQTHSWNSAVTRCRHLTNAAPDTLDVAAVSPGPYKRVRSLRSDVDRRRSIQRTNSRLRRSSSILAEKRIHDIVSPRKPSRLSSIFK